MLNQSDVTVLTKTVKKKKIIFSIDLVDGGTVSSSYTPYNSWITKWLFSPGYWKRFEQLNINSDTRIEKVYKAELVDKGQL